MGHLFNISRPQQKPNFATFASFSGARSSKRIGKCRTCRLFYAISCSLCLNGMLRSFGAKKVKKALETLTFAS